MNTRSNRASYVVSFCGIISALCIVVMFMTSILPIGVYVFPALAGLLIWTVFEQLGRKWAIITYFSVSLLSLFLIPDMESKMIFIFFLGYYPTIKDKFQRIKNIIIRFILKLIIFNAAMLVAYFLIINIVGAAQIMQDFEDFGKYASLIFLGMGNFAFLMLDYVMNSLFFAYLKWIKPKLNRRFR